MKGTIITNFTIGFGNNIFQYCFGRLLAEKYGMDYHHPPLNALGIPGSSPALDSVLPTFGITDANYKVIFSKEHPFPASGCNIVVNGYFEDYEIYGPHLDKIRSWFASSAPSNKNTSDLILHFRLQNRLVQHAHFINHVPAAAYIRAIEGIEFDKLHIITDAKKWTPYSESDIFEIHQELSVGPNPPSRAPLVATDDSINYINSLVDGLAKYEPIIHCSDAEVIPGSGALRGGFMDDFNLIRQFEQVMFKDSTFSWWAATLGGATCVRPFAPWKPNKGAKNKNLGQTNYPGWRGWGTIEDLTHSDVKFIKE